jgi:hypothetical protein
MPKIRQFIQFFTITALTLNLARAELTWQEGWNLLGNGLSQEINVSSVFNNPDKFITVWKWNTTLSTWAFYSPSLSESELNAYVQSKGYQSLSTIKSKEGFWVNAKTAGSAKTSSDNNGVFLNYSDLAVGWNLMASSDAKTPSELAINLMPSLAASDKNISTIWTWDASKLNWRFHAPSLESQGLNVLQSYIANKNYLSFTSPLESKDGFWMNVAPSTSTKSNSDPNSAMPVVAVISAGI